MMIKCSKCGKEIDAKSNNCIYCGVSLELAELNKENDEINKKHTNKKLIVIIELGLIIFLVILYINLFGKRITDYVKIEREAKLEQICNDNYSGNWNSNQKICETEVGNVEIK